MANPHKSLGVFKRLRSLVLASVICMSIPARSTEDAGFACSGAENCGELGVALGKIMVLLGASYVPHYFNLKNQDDEDISGQVALGFGSEKFKEFSLEVNSPVSGLKNTFLNTELQFQYRGQELPFILRYNFGVDYQHDFNGYHYLRSGFGIGMENVEESNRIRVGPHGTLKYLYRPQDNWIYETGLSAWYNETAAWRFSAGTQYRGRSLAVPMSIEIAYEENKLLDLHNYLVIIGLVI